MGTFRKNRFSFDLNNRLKGGTNSDRPLLVSEFKREFDLLAALLQTDEVIVVNYAEAQTLITDYNAGTGDGLAAGSHYFISDKADKGILLLAVTPNQFSLEGQGIFLNPDFQGVGDYTGIPLFNLNQGVWYAGLEGSLSFADVVFWNGYHYKMIDSGELAGTSPDVTPLAYTVLPKSAANVGYIEEVDFILYDFANDVIIEQHDKRGNKWNPDNVASFQRGNNACANMIINGFGDIDNINQRGVCNGTLVSNGASLNLDNTFTGVCGSNNLIGNNNVILYGTSEIQDCTFNSLTSIIITDTNHTGKEINSLGSTFNADLDMDDVAIYAANQLTIPTTLNYVGIFTLRNNGAVTIDKITNLPITHEVNFYVQSGNSKLFDHTAIGAAVADELVSDETAINKNIGKTNTSDRIGKRRSGNLKVRTLIEKLV